MTCADAESASVALEKEPTPAGRLALPLPATPHASSADGGPPMTPRSAMLTPRRLGVSGAAQVRVRVSLHDSEYKYDQDHA